MIIIIVYKRKGFRNRNKEIGYDICNRSTDVYLFELRYLYIILHWVLHRPTNFAGIMMIGFVSFILGDLIKTEIAVWVGQEVMRRRRQVPKG